MFRKKESDMLEKTPGSSGKPRPSWTKKNGNASLNNINFSSPAASGSAMNRNNDLAPPPFVSPGGNSNKSKVGAGKSYPTSSYLNKPTGTPLQSSSSKPNATSSSPGFGGLTFSPSPAAGGKSKVNGASWKDRVGPAASPGSLAGKKSYLNKGNDSSMASLGFNETTTASSSMLEVAEPDIKIKVNVDIQEKIKARQRAARPIPVREESVPEHIRKAREREARRLRAEEEKEYRAASLLQAAFLGWYARVQYPKLLAENADRLTEMRRKEALAKKRLDSALKIQKTFRMYPHRKRYLFVLDCKRRRERNAKEIKQIQKTIKNMPKTIKSDIKELKKDYAEKKKEIKKAVKKRIKDEEAKMDEIKKSGQDMIEYWKSENKKVENQKVNMKKEQKVLAKQCDVLMAKSEEIAKNFKSLQQFVDKKQAAVNKHKLSDEKCRHRYLPRYRQDLTDKNRQCMTEYRIKELYRKRLEMIVKEIEQKSKDPSLVKDVKKALKACKKEMAAMPKVPVPQGLEQWLT